MLFPFIPKGHSYCLEDFLCKPHWNEQDLQTVVVAAGFISVGFGQESLQGVCTQSVQCKIMY